jgi:hypothetical protein
MVKKLLIALIALPVVGIGAVAAIVVRPTDAPEYRGEPPTLSTDGAIMHTTSQEFAMSATALAAWQRRNPLVSFLKPSGGIPAVESTTPLSGEWFTNGARRRVNLVGGQTTAERILEIDDRVFRYQVWGFTTPARYLVQQAVGEIRYEPLGENRSRLVWTYSLTPRAFFTRPMLERFMRNEFAPFMDNGLAAMAAAAKAQ